MNETHGPITSGGISQDIPGYARLRFFYLLIPRHVQVSLENVSWDIPGFSDLSQVILGYPITETLYWDTRGYPDFSESSLSFFQMTAPDRPY